MPTYEEILSRLDEALAIADRLGLGAEVAASRFVRYRVDLERAIELARLDREGRLTRDDHEAALEHLPQYLAALSESQQLGEVLAHLADVQSSVLRPKLRDALRGPVLPSDEDPNSNHARNTLFELTLAARLKRAGFNPVLGDRPDVACEIDGRVVGFECKRVFSEKKLAERIAQAGDTLRSDLETKGPAAGLGVIVVSGAKLFSPAQIPFPLRSERASRIFLNCWLQAMAADTEPVWTPRINKGPVIGIMFHVVALLENEERNRFAIGEWWFGVHNGENEAADTFSRLGEALQATAY